MTNFFINNGNKIDLLQLKEGIAIKSDDKFLKKYDTNNNSVWDNDEINQFMADLENADIDGNGKIDKNESISWYSKITNTAIDKVKSVFNSDDKNKVYESLGNILKENAEEQSIARISQNAKEGLDIYHIAIGGDVSKGYNSIKELFDTEYAGDKVYRQLARKQVSSQLLEKAHSSNGLTAKEYVQEKIALLKALLGADKLSNAEQKNIEESIKNINFNQLDTFILRLSNAENEEYNKLQKDVISDLIINNNLDNNKELGFKNVKLNSVGAFLQSSKVEEKMSFNKIFELEMGVPFNQNNSIQKYEESLQRMQMITMVHNKIEGLKNELTSLARVPAPYEPSHLQEVLALLPQLFESSEEMNNFLEQYGIKINNNNGFISYNYDIDNYPTTGINTAKDVEAETKAQQKAQAMCMALVARLNEKYEKLLDGKTLEDFQNDLKSSYEMAYGVKNSVDLASKFQESQQEGVGYIKMGVGFAGIAIAVLSDGTLLPLTGMLIGAFGATGIGAWEAKTKKGGMTKEDAQAIKQELITSGILTLTGLGEGAAAAKIGQTLLKSCPKFVQYIGEYGSMAVMGALTDYAVMGDIDLSQETISNLINIATGIITHRKMARMKEHIPSKQVEVEIEATVVDDASIMTTLMNKVKQSDEILKTKDEIINSSEFKELSPENQELLLKTIDDFATIKNTTGTNTDDANILLNIKMKRGSSNEDINNLSNFLNKYPKYKNEILDIVNSNYNIKFGETLDGSIASHIDDIIKLIEANPNYKEQIVDYIKVQRRANNDTSNPTASISNYIETLNKYPEHKDFIAELSKNGNLDAKSTDGGINTIEAALKLHIKDGFSKDDILILSRQNYTVPYIRKQLSAVKKEPELRNTILNKVPEYTFIDNNPASTLGSIIDKRFEIKESLEKNFPNEMEKLNQTLGDKFFFKVKWEEIIPANATSEDIKSILNTLNESSKFFARTSVNEQNYGKNIQWASKMNDISNGAEYLISQGKDFDSVLSYIAGEYHAYDESTTLATNHSKLYDRRLASGKYRGDDIPNGYYTTSFDNIDNYSEYFDRFARQNGVRKAPYDDIELTQILYNKHVGDGSSGTMYHPANKYVEPGLNHVRERYNELQPLFDKVKNGQKLSKQDINYANEKIAEIYFLMANVMPYERGSNGISDILMRSIYKGLGIEQPALKHGVSLDLEAFCMDLNEYKKKWNCFFENN